MAATTAKPKVDRKTKNAIEKRNVALERLEIEYVRASQIAPNDYNPNRQSDHDFRLLIASMLEDGFTQPIVGVRDGRRIVDGEHRWTGGIVVNWLRVEGKAAAYTDDDLRWARDNRAAIIARGGDYDPLLPVVWTDMTLEQARIATLRHNRARGSEDIELTAALLRDLEQLGALDWAQDSLQLDDVEIERLLEDMSAPEALAGDEFGQAWEPDTIGQQMVDAAESGSADNFQYGVVGNQATSMSPGAVEAMREREKRLAEAKSAEEREVIRRESTTFRIVAFYSDDEARMVRAVVGDNPAAGILALCRRAQEQGWEATNGVPG